MLTEREIRAFLNVWTSYKALETEWKTGPTKNEEFANEVRQCCKAIEAVIYEMGCAIGAGPKIEDGYFIVALKDVAEKRQEGCWFYGRTYE